MRGNCKKSSRNSSYQWVKQWATWSLDYLSRHLFIFYGTVLHLLINVAIYSHASFMCAFITQRPKSCFFTTFFLWIFSVKIHCGPALASIPLTSLKIRTLLLAFLDFWLQHFPVILQKSLLNWKFLYCAFYSCWAQFPDTWKLKQWCCPLGLASYSMDQHYYKMMSVHFSKHNNEND